METGKAKANGGLPADGGGTEVGKPPTGHPFGPNVTAARPASVESKGSTIGFKCRVTVKGGLTFKGIASLFGGQDGGGTHIGGPDGQDLSLELEGAVVFNGGSGDAVGFAGQDGGGPHIGEPDTGRGPTPPRKPTPQYGPDQSGVALQGA